MEIDTIISQIRDLPLDERFLIMEKTLESIKNEELKIERGSLEKEPPTNYAINKRFKDFSVNEKSLAEDWLSEEDKRWDNLL